MDTQVTDLPIAVIERERRWEMESVTRGVERYREAEAEVANAADTEPGKRMLVDIMTNLIPAIQATQEEALTGITGGGAGRTPSWWLPILCLEPDKMALIAARATINSGVMAEGSATAIALDIAKAVKLQREFDLWREKEAERAKEAPGEYVNLYKLMLSRVKRVDARNAQRWMRKAEDLDRIEWDLETRVAFGMKLLELLVENGGGYFEITVVASGGGRRRTTERKVKLTPLAEAYIADVNDTSELNRPWLMPMLSPPAPWKEVV